MRIFSHLKISLLQTSRFLKANHKICESLNECFTDILKDRNRAVAIPRAHAVNNPFGMIDNVDFFCFPVTNDLVIYSSVMMFRRYHPLLLTMNEKIRAISESGLLSKWEKENTIIGKGDGENNDGKSKNEGGHGGGQQMKLRLDHVQGAFILLSIGVLISGTMFLFELFASHFIQWMTVRCPTNKLFKVVQEFLCYA